MNHIPKEWLEKAKNKSWFYSRYDKVKVSLSMIMPPISPEEREEWKEFLNKKIL